MRLITLITTAALLSIQANAQKVKFTDTSNVWFGGHHSSDGTNLWVTKIGGSITFKGKEYRALSGAHPRFSIQYVREDTVAKRVYALADSLEIVLYDFSLNLGDTFTMVNKADTFGHYVSSVDTVLIRNVEHKVLMFRPLSNNPRFSWAVASYTVIEGIGSTDAVLTPYKPESALYSESLFCLTTNNTTPEVVPKVGFFDNKESCNVSVNEISEEGSELMIVPNPVNSTSVIRLNKQVKTGVLAIYNQLGQLVVELNIKNEKKLSIGKLVEVPGLYYYQLLDEGADEIYKGKFLYQE